MGWGTGKLTYVGNIHVTNILGGGIIDTRQKTERCMRARSECRILDSLTTMPIYTWPFAILELLYHDSIVVKFTT